MKCSDLAIAERNLLQLNNVQCRSVAKIIKKHGVQKMKKILRSNRLQLMNLPIFILLLGLQYATKLNRFVEPLDGICRARGWIYLRLKLLDFGGTCTDLFLTRELLGAILNLTPTRRSLFRRPDQKGVGDTKAVLKD